MGDDEVLWNTFSNINEWIRFSDTKATLIIGIYGAVSAFAFPSLIDHMELIRSHNLLIILFVVGVCFSILSVMGSLWSLNPILKIRARKPSVKSLIFFDSIANHYDSHDKYHKALTQAFSNEKEIERQLTQQIWANSKIASKKYYGMSWSLRFLFGSILSGLLFIFLAIGYAAIV